MLLKEIRLQANNVHALYNFYKDVLELPVDYFKGKSISVTAGKSQLIFEETNGIENPFYHFAFNIPSNKFEEAFEWMKRKVALLWLDDYKSYIADFTNWNAKSFYFLDTAGNILEMIARFDLKDNAVEKFSSAQIRNISEIGLVLPEESFDNEVNEFMQRFSLSYFNKQPPKPGFRAIGNDEGLFITVPENRTWYPLKDKPSRILPLYVTFMEDGKMNCFHSNYFNHKK
jgi:catechol-2,3-dioxygenase